MQVTAREGARGVAARASEVRAQSGPIGSTRGEALRLDAGRSARWPAWRPADRVQDEAPTRSPGSVRDLGPARGVLTAITVGLLLWIVAFGAIQALSD